MIDNTGRRLSCPGLATITILALLVCAAGNPPVLAESETRVVDDNSVFRVGGYLSDFKTDASVGSGGVFGTVLRLEDELMLDSDSSAVRVDGFVRFNKRHSLEFGLWSLNRNGLTEANKRIMFDGNLFDTGVIIASEFDTSWLRVGWRFSALRTERGEAGFSAGLSAYSFNMGLAGEATVSDEMGGTTQSPIRAEEDFLAPVPTVGMFVTYAIKPKLILLLKADFLNFEVDTLEGNVLDTRALLEWYFSSHFGLGAGFNNIEIQVRDLSGDPFSVDYRQKGWLGYITLAF